MLVGLTGLYCAGKNYAAQLLEQQGIPVLDLDKLGHSVLKTEKAAITAQFGSGILDAEGTVDRRLLGKLVFGSREKLAALEAIVHPAVDRQTMQWVQAQTGPVCVINAALLHKSGIFPSIKHIILVKSFFLTRLIRAKQRDKLPFLEILTRFKSQTSFRSKYLEKSADIYRIHNNGIGILSPLLNKYFTKQLQGALDLWKRKSYC